MPSMDQPRRHATSSYEVQLLQQGSPELFQTHPTLDTTWISHPEAFGQDLTIEHGWCSTQDNANTQYLDLAHTNGTHDFNPSSSAKENFDFDYASSQDSAESVHGFSSPTFSTMSMNYSPAVHQHHPTMVAQYPQPHGQMVYPPSAQPNTRQGSYWYSGHQLGPPVMFQPLMKDHDPGHTFHEHRMSASDACQTHLQPPPPPAPVWHSQDTMADQSQTGPKFIQPQLHARQSVGSRRNRSSLEPSVIKVTKRQTRSSIASKASVLHVGAKAERIKANASPAPTVRSISSHNPSADDEDDDADADEAAQLEYDDEEELEIGRTCINSRNHSIFTPEKQPDGKYHCPFANKGRCGHKPRELKCDYYKMVEAHIKQYRCMKSQEGGCDKPMTSRAIRFRHEREQHENSKHRCLFEECARAREDNAFPRAYNRDDHMKRTHDWVPDADHKKRAAAKPDRKRKRDTQKVAVQKRMRQSDKKSAKAARSTTAAIPSPVPITAAPTPTTIPPPSAPRSGPATGALISRPRAANKTVAPAPVTYVMSATLPAPALYNNSAPHGNGTITCATDPYVALPHPTTCNFTASDEEYDAAWKRWSDLRKHVHELVHQIQNLNSMDAMEQVAQQGTVLRDMARDIHARFAPGPPAVPIQPWNPNGW